MGDYSIKFKVQKSAYSNFERTMKIKVVDKETFTHVNLIKSSLIIGKKINVNEMFSIVDEKSYQILTDDEINYLNSEIEAKIVGTSKFTFIFDESYADYIYEFSITIKEQPLYTIEVYDIEDNTIIINMSDNDVAYVNFSVTDRDGEYVLQSVLAETSNSEIVIIETISDDVLIKLRGMKQGNAIITLFLISNPEITTEIFIFVQ